MLEPWVAWTVSLPSCSSQFICMQGWEYLLCQQPPCPVCKPPPCLPWSSSHIFQESSPPGFPSPPLLPIWMNVSSLTPSLSDFHTGRLSDSFGCFFCFLIGCCPSFGCARSQSVSTYSSIMAGSLESYYIKWYFSSLVKEGIFTLYYPCIPFDTEEYWRYTKTREVFNDR